MTEANDSHSAIVTEQRRWYFSSFGFWSFDIVSGFEFGASNLVLRICSDTIWDPYGVLAQVRVLWSQILFYLIYNIRVSRGPPC